MSLPIGSIKTHTTIVPARYRISLALKTTSPLGIHAGYGSDDLIPTGKVPQDYNFRPRLKSCDHLVVRDYQGKPYIPGTSLKGVIRAYLSRFRNTMKGSESDSACINLLDWMLGTESRRAISKDPNSDQGSGGSVIFEDAFIFQQTGQDQVFEEASLRQIVEWKEAPKNFDHLPFYDATQQTYVEHHVAIHRTRGAVDHGKVFSAELVPPGVSFGVHLTIRSGEKSELACKKLIRALAGFNVDYHHCPIQLGSGTMHGWGRLVCLPSSIQVERLTPDGHDKLDDSFWRTEWQEGLTTPPPNKHPRLSIGIELNFNGTFLVKDPGECCGVFIERNGITSACLDTEKLIDSKKSQHAAKSPDQCPRVAEIRTIAVPQWNQRKLYATPLLPSTSFKGCIRSQAERIARTVHPEIRVSPLGQFGAVNVGSEKLSQWIFGFDGERSGLWCSDFSGELIDITNNLKEMVAIDRFTGGASNHAKFDCLGFYKPTLCGVLAIDLPSNDKKLTLEVLGLMILTLRDLMEGEITLGFGATKGFGECTAKITHLRLGGSSTLAHDTFAGLEQPIDTKKLESWLNTFTTSESLVDASFIQQSNAIINECLRAFREGKTNSRREAVNV